MMKKIPYDEITLNEDDNEYIKNLSPMENESPHIIEKRMKGELTKEECIDYLLKRHGGKLVFWNKWKQRLEEFKLDETKDD